jgi:hypothetical protein
MAQITEASSPLEDLVIGDYRVTNALWEENYGPAQHRINYIKARCKEAGYPDEGEPNA